MNNQTLALVAAALTILFAILNFTIASIGTLFLVLAVTSGMAATYLFTRPKK